MAHLHQEDEEEKLKKKKVQNKIKGCKKSSKIQDVAHLHQAIKKAFESKEFVETNMKKFSKTCLI